MSWVKSAQTGQMLDIFYYGTKISKEGMRELWEVTSDF